MGIQVSAVLFAMLSVMLSTGQRDTPGKQEIAKHPLVLEAPAPPQAEKIDFKKMREESEELSRLAGTIPSDLAEIGQGKLPKDTVEKLKRIEKLSKHLRNELSQ